MSDADTAQHWRTVYATKAATAVSWHQPSPTPSLKLIAKTGLGPGARVIDVGGGASSLVDRLLDQGFQVCVLDIADNALEIARSRLGERAQGATWIVADITDWRTSAQFDLWHDRAVFHFLTEPKPRARYLATLKTVVVPGGWVVMATFAPSGPDRCSGLPVQRWSAEALTAELGEEFRLVESAEETHETPGGARQAFTWTLFRRVVSAERRAAVAARRG